MRNKATCLLGLIYLVVLLRPGLPSMLFSLNARYIQTELCVQKDKSGNTCKGACFMKKSLQAQQQEPSPDLPGLTFEEIELAQLQPTCDVAPARMPVGGQSWARCMNEQRNDQFVSDLPVPPPWINDRLS